MTFRGKDERLSYLEAYLTLTSVKDSRLTEGKTLHLNERGHLLLTK